jgi:Na+-translocating ferredoxin:NAD+ oxidoreductase RnfG subunit
MLPSKLWSSSGKLEALVAKTLGIEELKIVALVTEERGSSKNSGQFDILSLNKMLVTGKQHGFVVEGRAYSCREGGCPADPDNPANENAGAGYEYFDFIVILDNSFGVLRVLVTHYNATKGHEITSRAFLRQFTGKSPSRAPVYGRNIDGISGATVSGIAITSAVSSIIDYISSIYNDILNQDGACL